MPEVAGAGVVVDVSSDTGAAGVVVVVSTVAGDVAAPSGARMDVVISDPAVVSEVAVVAEVVVLTTAEDAEVEGGGGGAADVSKEFVDGKMCKCSFLRCKRR